MQAIMKSLFDVCYLLFAVLTGVMLMRKSQGRKLIHLFGVMSVALGCGDAFHLVPRVLNYWLAGDFTAWLGIGTLVTSITMTVFYLLLEYARRERYAITGEKGVLCAIWALSLVRIVLCLFPQNQWTQADAPWIWGIYRNIPFAVLGAVTVALWLLLPCGAVGGHAADYWHDGAAQDVHVYLDAVHVWTCGEGDEGIRGTLLSLSQRK